MRYLKRIDESYNDDAEDYSQGEMLEKMLEGLRERIRQHLSSRSIELDDIECDQEGTEFSILYYSKAFDGAIPARISYYLEDLSEIISEEIGIELSWGFGPNGNCTLATFRLGSEIDPKYYKVKNTLKYI